MPLVCVQWPRFGPYHLARLRAAHHLFAEHSVEVVGVETAGNDLTYDWRVERGEEPFRRVQVFPDREFEAIPPAEMHVGVTAALDRLDPDAVAIISYSTPDARAALAWCRRRRRTAVLMAATKADDAPRVAWREHVKRRLVSQFDAALVGGTPQRRYLEALGFSPERIFQPYNVVDNAFFASGAEEARRASERWRSLPGLEANTPFFLASNRFLRPKNLDGLLQAYRRYREAAPRPWRLLLLGDGPERPGLEAIVREYGIEGVVFCGFRQVEELPAYYGLAAAFVHPALKETWGLVVNEAMAAGLPVLVSARAGCARDLVQDGQNGYLLDPRDEAALAGLMTRMASMPEGERAAMGRRSREIVDAWSPACFAKGLWRAVEAGKGAADRPLAPLPGALLWALRRTARTVNAFHTVDDAA